MRSTTRRTGAAGGAGALHAARGSERATRRASGDEGSIAHHCPLRRPAQQRTADAGDLTGFFDRNLLGVGT